MAQLGVGGRVVSSGIERVEARDAAKHPTMQRAVLTTKKSQQQMARVPRLRNPEITN